MALYPYGLVQVAVGGAAGWMRRALERSGVSTETAELAGQTLTARNTAVADDNLDGGHGGHVTAPLPPYEPEWVPTLFGLDDLLRILDVTPDVPPVPARCLPSGHGGVLGSQMLAQQVVLAERTTPGKRVHTLHTLFLRSGTAERSLEIDMERLAHGRSVDSVALTFRQGTERLSRADVMLAAPDADFARHGTALPPEVCGPADAEPVRRALLPWEAALVPPARPFQLDLWLRAPLVPDDPTTWRALLAFTAETLPASNVLQGHGLAPTPDRPLFVVTLSQTVTFLDELDVREWHLFRLYSPHSGGGRALSRGEVYGADGRLAAVFETVGMLRGPKPSAGHSG